MDLELELLSRMIKTKHDEKKKLTFETKNYDFYHFLKKLNIEKTEYEELIKNLNLKGLIEATDKKIAAKQAAIAYVLTKESL